MPSNTSTQFTARYIVSATPMSLAEYNQLLGWTLPENEYPMEQGFLVTYQNPENAEVDQRVTWIKKSIFLTNYVESNTFDQRLNIELSDLYGRSIPLANYIQSGQHLKLGKEQSGLLIIQAEIMGAYGVILAQRKAALADNYKDNLSICQKNNRPIIIDKQSWPIAQLYLEQGYVLARANWNAANQFVAYNPGQPKLPAERFWVEANKEAAEQHGGFMDVAPYFTIKTADNKVQSGWVPSASDLLAKDWIIYG